jgi:hypothetical protein
MKSRISKAITGLLLTACMLIGLCVGIEACRVGTAQAADPSRAVMLDTSSVTTEVCVLVVHRSRMHNRMPVARCATAAELKDLVR